MSKAEIYLTSAQTKEKSKGLNIYRELFKKNTHLVSKDIIPEKTKKYLLYLIQNRVEVSFDVHPNSYGVDFQKNSLIYTYLLMPSQSFKNITHINFKPMWFDVSGRNLFNRIDINTHKNPMQPQTELSLAKTLIHEIFHQYDSADSKHPTNLFYNISWGSLKKLAWLGYLFKGDSIFANDASENSGSWVNNYSKHHPIEDWSTTGEEYVMEGSQLRDEIRESMKRGQFEKALKYLFYKRLSICNGEEYNLSKKSPSLTFREVRSFIEAYIEKLSAENKPIDEIERLLSVLNSFEQYLDQNSKGHLAKVDKNVLTNDFEENEKDLKGEA